MYSQNEIESAIEAGVIDSDTAKALQNHIAQMRDSPIQDEEHFRLITGFNDIFVGIAAVIMLFAASGIGVAVYRPLSGLFIAATAWGLAEFFTRKRRMAFPSIILLVALVGGIFSAIFNLSEAYVDTMPSFTISSIVAAIAAALHWLRFKVPITIAAGTAAIAATIISAILIPLSDRIDESPLEANLILILLLIAGLSIFAFAMWWDISDKSRETRRSDVAFWLHLLAAPMIAHPLFYFIGATGGDDISWVQAIAVVGAYIMMGAIAVIIDRRAILVSSLAYVLLALAFLFDRFGAIGLDIALTAFVIGSALLMLSAFWSYLRKVIVTKMPAIIRNNVPAAL